MKQHWKKTFIVIWSGQAFSIIGSAAVQFAIIWWLTLQTGSADVLAISGIVSFLPLAVIGPFAGVWVDRLSRKWVMIAADSFVALTSAALAAVFLFGTPQVEIVYLVLFLRAVGTAFHMPAMQSAISMLVPEDKLQKTAAWGQFLQSGSYMLGPVIGAMLMASFDMPAVLLSDILGAALACTTVGIVKIPNPEKKTEKQRVWQDIRDGVKIIWHHDILRKLALPIIIVVIVYFPVSTLSPLLVKAHFNGTTWDNGIVEFLFSFGMVASALLLGIWKGIQEKARMIALAFVSMGLILAACGLLPRDGVVGYMVLSGLIGFAANFYAIPYTAIVQETVPPESMGRVFAIFASLMSFGTPVGLFIAGPVAAAIGVNTWFLYSGVIILLCGIICLYLIRKKPAPAE